eukprot:120205-Lingulodinium_polyedra.AAC.1
MSSLMCPGPRRCCDRTAVTLSSAIVFVRGVRRRGSFKLSEQHSIHRAKGISNRGARSQTMCLVHVAAIVRAIGPGGADWSSGR